MKNASLMVLTILFSFHAYSQSNRPQSGDIMIGLQFDPFESLRYVVNADYPGGTSGVFLNGIDARRYSGSHAHQFGLNWNLSSNHSGARPFNTDPAYTVETSNYYSYLNASYAFLWLYNFGENWQLAYGPQASAGANYTRIDQDYSHSAEELWLAGQRGIYQEDFEVFGFEAALIFLAEINYFFSNSIYLGASWNVGARVNYRPEYSRNYISLTAAGLEEIEQTTPESIDSQLFDRSGMMMKFGLVF